MYALSAQLNVTFQEALTHTTEALKAEGFGVLTEIDVQATMRMKLDVEVKPYAILGACNPQLAHRALSAVPEIGLLLPCNVIVREESRGHVVVSFINPSVMSQLVDHPDVLEVAEEAKVRLSRAHEALIASVMSA